MPVVKGRRKTRLVLVPPLKVLKLQCCRCFVFSPTSCKASSCSFRHYFQSPRNVKFFLFSSRLELWEMAQKEEGRKVTRLPETPWIFWGGYRRFSFFYFTRLKAHSGYSSLFLRPRPPPFLPFSLPPFWILWHARNPFHHKISPNTLHTRKTNSLIFIGTRGGFSNV